MNKFKTNGKKTFCKNGLEEDCTSSFGRKYLCYVSNIRGIKKFVKKTMNKRMRRFSKYISVKERASIQE